MAENQPSLPHSPQSSPAESSRATAEVPSRACDFVLTADKPSPEDGGPCATCAFRLGTEANLTAHTMTLARLCVEGFRQFHCHETPRLCRGYIAAANLRGLPLSEVERNKSEVYGLAADAIAEFIAAAQAVLYATAEGQ